MSDDVIFKPTSAKQELILQVVQNVQIVVIGGAAGSGKSYLLQGMPLMFMDDPRSECIMFRRTSPQFTGQGGIWDTAQNIFRRLPSHVRPKIVGKPDYTMKFRDPDTGTFNGMKIKFSHMQNENDKYNIQGLQFTFIGVDEACQFEWSQLNLAA